MTQDEQFEQIRKNILALDWSLDDAPYMGVSTETIKGIRFAIRKILEETDITIESLLQERREKKWFEYKGE